MSTCESWNNLTANRRACNKKMSLTCLRTQKRKALILLWVLEGLVWPLKPLTPYPGTNDGTLPTHFQTLFDLSELLAFVAADTEKISLGTAVIDILEEIRER
jgi:hypothetical protein